MILRLNSGTSSSLFFELVNWNFKALYINLGAKINVQNIDGKTLLIISANN